jgi:hypothetical protein
MVQAVILAPKKVNRLQRAAQESEEGKKYDEWVGGVWQLYGRVCGGPFRARGTGVMVAPMVAGAGGQGRVSRDQIWSTRRTGIDGRFAFQKLLVFLMSQDFACLRQS